MSTFKLVMRPPRKNTDLNVRHGTKGKRNIMDEKGIRSDKPGSAPYTMEFGPCSMKGPSFDNRLADNTIETSTFPKETNSNEDGLWQQEPIDPKLKHMLLLQEKDPSFFEKPLQTFDQRRYLCPSDVFFKPKKDRKKRKTGYFCKGEHEEKVRAAYNFSDEKKPMFCRACCKPGMINIVADKIKKKNQRPDPTTGLFAVGCPYCGKRASHNYPQEEKGIVCSKHKNPGMINIHQRGTKCSSPDCVESARYNIHGETKGMYCKTCKKPNMYRVVKTWGECENQECVKRASFNYSGIPKVRFCERHKEKHMVNVITEQRILKKRKGLSPEKDVRPIPKGSGYYCNGRHTVPKRASFNYPGETKMLYCKDCALVGMVNLNNERKKKKRRLTKII